MRLACLQFAPQVGDTDNNISRADAVLSRASSDELDRLDLLVLPELAFTGYNFKSLEDIGPYLENAKSGISSLWARTIALDHRCTVVVGYPEKVDAECPASSEYYNSALVVDGNGDTVGNYRKSPRGQGEVFVYGILGHGAVDLLIVDTDRPPRYKLTDVDDVKADKTADDVLEKAEEACQPTLADERIGAVTEDAICIPRCPKPPRWVWQHEATLFTLKEEDSKRYSEELKRRDCVVAEIAETIISSFQQYKAMVSDPERESVYSQFEEDSSQEIMVGFI
ncbi:hypothetical protein NEMBOFW57_006230 [Staphylotrichum longicolle]|uniref:CN hydrolase domain-containing protein n=1 Tax=Staphylotrichum longicolle TaxID=669026 RepID=A0AAD4F2Y6_9PEZI|nr:hypothetical protein NEMBOFW57_006230 [Staphylotrichum longicolle]